MTRAFSTREKVMLVVLAVLLLALLYYLVVWKPCMETIQNEQYRMAEAQYALDDETALLARMKSMEAELAEIKGSGESVAPIPDYDNAENVVKLLNTVLARADAYSVDFGDPVEDADGMLVRRTVTLSVTCSTWSQAKKILTAISNCDYRCRITGLSVTSRPLTGQAADIAQNAVSMSLTVVFYELMS